MNLPIQARQEKEQNKGMKRPSEQTATERRDSLHQIEQYLNALACEHHSDLNEELWAAISETQEKLIRVKRLYREVK